MFGLVKGQTVEDYFYQFTETTKNGLLDYMFSNNLRGCCCLLLKKKDQFSNEKKIKQHTEKLKKG